jgi:hypothetical protein
MSEREELAEVHAPVIGVFARKAGIVGCSCMDARQWRSYLNARGDRSTPAWRAHFAEQVAAHDDRIRAEALAPVLALADEMGCSRLHTQVDVESGQHNVWCNGATWSRATIEERLRAAAGTPTHDATEEDADE